MCSSSPRTSSIKRQIDSPSPLGTGAARAAGWVSAYRCIRSVQQLHQGDDQADNADGHDPQVAGEPGFQAGNIFLQVGLDAGQFGADAGNVVLQLGFDFHKLGADAGNVVLQLGFDSSQLGANAGDVVLQVGFDFQPARCERRRCRPSGRLGLRQGRPWWPGARPAESRRPQPWLWPPTPRLQSGHRRLRIRSGSLSCLHPLSVRPADATNTPAAAPSAHGARPRLQRSSRPPEHA